MLILVARNIKIRYKESVLGFFWSLLGPLFLILIYSVFLGLLKAPINLPILVTGIIVWQFFATCLGDSLQAIMGNANLVTKAAFPRIILPAAMVVANFVNLLLSLLVLLVYLLVIQTQFNFLIFLPLVLLTHFSLCLGVALIVSCSNVFFRDTEHITNVVMLAWFFLSPIVYEADRVTNHFSFAVQCLFFANPMTGIVCAYRSILVSPAQLPSLGLTAISFVVAWAILAAGVFVFRKCQARFGDEL